MKPKKVWQMAKELLKPTQENMSKVFSLGERPYFHEDSVREFAKGEEIYKEPEEFQGDDPWNKTKAPLVDNENKKENKKNDLNKVESNKEKSKQENKKQENKRQENKPLVFKFKKKDTEDQEKLKGVRQVRKAKVIKPKKLAALVDKTKPKNHEAKSKKIEEKDKQKCAPKNKQAVKAGDIIYRKELKIEEPKEQETLATSLQENICKLKETYNIPLNTDVIIREFSIDVDNPVSAAIVYIEGMGDRTTINDNILTPLMVFGNLDGINTKDSFLKTVVKHLVPSNQVEIKYNYEDMIKGINTGNTALIIDGHVAGIVIESKGFPKRGIERSQNEQVVKGPQESFSEHLRTNTGLIRKRLKTEALVTEMFKLGLKTNTDVALMYLKDVVNSKLVNEVRRRLKSFDADAVLDSGTLEQFIIDSPYQIVPTVLNTERPDRACSYILEGSMVIIVDGDCYAMIMPITFFSLLHSPEDAYLKWPLATFIRWFRVLASFVVLFLPAIYISITDYHEEMIPTDLLLAIAAARETVPYPAWLEVLFMEISFELIREAGLRIPSAIGPTIGIVGAIVLGQAAVQAGIVSPILVIVVAITGIGSFAIPNYTLSFSFRLLRFIFIFLAIMWGFYGLALGVSLLALNLASLTSFGVPFLAGVSPYYSNHVDILSRKPIWQHSLRPGFMRTKDPIRQAELNRPWEPSNNLLDNKDKGKENDE